MNLMKSSLVVLAVVLLAAWIPTDACAGDKKWTQVAALQGGDEAQEVSVNKEISQCKIKCTEGPVIINTVVVREGANKTPHTVAKRFEKDDEVVIDLGGKKNVTGFRISAKNRGKFTVSVK